MEMESINTHMREIDEYLFAIANGITGRPAPQLDGEFARIGQSIEDISRLLDHSMSNLEKANDKTALATEKLEKSRFLLKSLIPVIEGIISFHEEKLD